MSDAKRGKVGAIVIACAVGLVGGVAAIALGIASGASELEGLQLAARYTARLAFVMFMVVFVARAWHRQAPSRLSRLALTQRRALGLGFAVAHTVHLGALLTYLDAAGIAFKPSNALGALAYTAVLAMALTSSNAAQRWLGRSWKRVHLVGIHIIWFVFTIRYAQLLARGELFYMPFVVLALSGLGLRLAARRTARVKPMPRADQATPTEH